MSPAGDVIPFEPHTPDPVDEAIKKERSQTRKRSQDYRDRKKAGKSVTHKETPEGTQPPPPAAAREAQERPVERPRRSKLSVMLWTLQRATEASLDRLMKGNERPLLFALEKLVVAALILALLVGLGALGNLALLSKPTATMTGGGTFNVYPFAGWSVAVVLAAVVVAVETGGGVLLLELTGCTHMIPEFDGLSVTRKRVLAACAGTALVLTVGFEVMAAFMRDAAMHDDATWKAAWASKESGQVVKSAVAALGALPTWAQACLAGAMPIILLPAGVALGAVTDSLRVILANVLSIPLRAVALVAQLSRGCISGD